MQIIAPVNVPSLRIVWQAPAGGAVKQGDPVVRFDPSSTQQQLQEKDAALKQAQATLDQALADARITAEQDHRDLSSAKYDVEKARMEASKAEIVSKLQGEESRIDLGLSEQKLRVQEATVDLHATSDQAKIASLTRQQRMMVLIAAVGLWVVTWQMMLLLIAIGAIYRLFTKDAAPVQDQTGLLQFLGLLAALTCVAMLAEKFA